MTITLTQDELHAITGYKRPGDQMAELLRQGFSRARRSRTTGDVILERSHYDAVCAGQRITAAPQVRMPGATPQLRAV